MNQNLLQFCYAVWERMHVVHALSGHHDGLQSLILQKSPDPAWNTLHKQYTVPASKEPRISGTSVNSYNPCYQNQDLKGRDVMQSGVGRMHYHFTKNQCCCPREIF